MIKKNTINSKNSNLVIGSKGFTLVELLTVLVIIGVVLAIAIPSVGKMTHSSDAKKLEQLITMALEASDTYIDSYKKSFVEDYDKYNFNYQTLINSNLLKEEDIHCSGTIQATRKKGNNYTYNAYLMCKNKNGKEIYNNENELPDGGISIYGKFIMEYNIKLNDASGAKYNFDFTKENLYNEFVAYDLERPGVSAGISKFEYSFNGNDWTETIADSNSGVGSFTLTNTYDGKIYFRAYDLSGNVSETVNYTVKVDKEKPTGTITVASSNASYNSLDVKATLNATDTGGSTLKQMCVQESSDVNTCSFETYTASKTLTLSGTYDGIPRTIYAWYKDGVGNISDINSYTYTLYKKPTITTQITSSNIGTKSFDVSIGVTASDKGLEKVVWYYKKNIDTTYKTKETLNTTDVTTEVILKETILSLTTGTYNIYGEIYDALENKIKTNEISVTLNAISTASIASVNNTNWTNQNVIVTLPTASGMITQYQIGGTNGAWQTYNSSTKLSISSNGTIFYRYSDGINAGEYSSITISNIEKVVPTIVTDLSSGSITKTSATLSIKVKDTTSGLSKIIWYYKKSTDSSYSNQTDLYTAMNGATKGILTEVTKTKSLTNLVCGTTYNIYAVVYDVAGNKVTSATKSFTTSTCSVRFDFNSSSELTNNFNISYIWSDTFSTKNATVEVRSGNVYFYSPDYDTYAVISLKSKSSGIYKMSFNLNLNPTTTARSYCRNTLFQVPYFELIFSDNARIIVHPIHTDTKKYYTSYLPLPSATADFVVEDKIAGVTKSIGTNVSRNKYYQYDISVASNGALTLITTGYSYSTNVGTRKLTSVFFHPTLAWCGTDSTAYIDWFEFSAY